MVELCGRPRGSYYRRLRKPTAPLEDRRDEQTIVEELQRILAREPGYGYRRATIVLQRKGRRINHKRVLRLMRQQNLLCRRKRRFKPATTDSRHDLQVYPNLAKDLQVTRANQLWVSDITYVPCGPKSFVYLAVVIDAYSRRCVGWSLQAYLDTRLPGEALRKALRHRPCCQVHHSDRGRQYASAEYTGILTTAGAQLSMARTGNPYDNAIAESFFKTLKTEEVELQEYTTIDEVRASIRYFIDQRYNERRLHSSLGYRSPAEFEADQQPQPGRPPLISAKTVSP